MKSRHVPVLLEEVLRYLDLAPGHIVVDGTVGAGGHSQRILEQIGPEGVLIGLDRDPMMREIASTVLTDTNCYLYHANYGKLSDVLERHSTETSRPVSQVDRVLLDLGVSSDQLADEQRGFSFSSCGPLDLRFDPSRGEPAWKLLEQLSERQIEQIFSEYGEERFSRQIAHQVVLQRDRQAIRTASDLEAIVRAAVPARFQRTARRDPATRVFQALRIAANEELDQLDRVLEQDIYSCLVPGGRVVVISFHSLEDRIVKRAFRNQTRWQRLTKKPVEARAAEKRINPRSRSAKLRAAVKK